MTRRNNAKELCTYLIEESAFRQNERAKTMSNILQDIVAKPALIMNIMAIDKVIEKQRPQHQELATH